MLNILKNQKLNKLTFKISQSLETRQLSIWTPYVSDSDVCLR